MTSARGKVAPGPRGNLLLGELFRVRRDRLDFISKITQEHGDIVRFRMVHRILHLVSGPDHIRHVLQDNHANYQKGVGLAQAKRWLGAGLVTSEGDEWAWQRRVIQPLFQREELSIFAPVVTAATTAMLERWRGFAEHHTSIEVATEMMQLTLEIIAKIMFSSDITNAGEIGAAFTTALRDAMDRMVAIVAMPDWLPFPAKRRFKQAIRTLDEIVFRIIREHRVEDAVTKGDLVSILMAEHDGTGDRFGDGELRDQVVTILLAGHETTAISLAWTFYLLDQHPDAWVRIQNEVDSVLGGQTPTHEIIPQLVWTRMVYQESLRLYPPVWLIPRRTLAEDKIGGYCIPPDSDVLISPYVMHRHAKYWSNPEIFDPERFSADQAVHRPRYAYLPFGAGPRICVASSLAMMEALLILAMVAQRHRLQLVPGHRVIPEPLLTLRFRHGLAMTPRSR